MLLPALCKVSARACCGWGQWMDNGRSGPGRSNVRDAGPEASAAEACPQTQSLSSRLQPEPLAAALDHISQGIVLFDRDARLVLCNRRYLELYDLSATVVKPG